MKLRPAADYIPPAETHSAGNVRPLRQAAPAASRLQARLDFSRAKWQNKNAVIYPIVYEPVTAAPQAAPTWPQIIFIAPPDLIDLPPEPAPPLAESASPVLSEKVAEVVEKKPAPAAPPAPAPKSPAPAAPVSETLFASYGQPSKHLSTAVPLLLIAVLLLFVATYIFTIR